MPFPFKWVREPAWAAEPGQVIVLEMNPARVLPAVSVQPEWHGSGGIVHGAKDGGQLVEDHVREEIRDGRLVDAGRRIVGADEMRTHVWTTERHRAEFLARHPQQRVVAWVGNGNLLSNPHFVGFADGRLFHLASEAGLLPARSYTSLLVRKAGHPNRVAIESVSYRSSADGVKVFSGAGEDITSQVEYATFGQHVVRDGRPVDAAQMRDMAVAGQFYDLRHLFLFGRIPTGARHWLDAGLSAFWDDHCRLNVEAVLSATDGQPVTVDVRQFDHAGIRDAMNAKGYDEVSEPARPGHYALGDGNLRVVLLEGLYPHNMIGIREDGFVISAVFRGLSNRLGVTIRGAAQTMCMLGAKDALILDNGGDVMMSFGEDQVVGSAEGGRNRLRSVLLFRRSDDSNDLRPDDFRLVTYPKQFAPIRMT